VAHQAFPDIDIDFGDNSLIKDKMVEQWGEDSVAFISNYNTLQLSSLIKDISKREGIDFVEVNKSLRPCLRSNSNCQEKARHQGWCLYSNL
jgi:DNA polymerase III alpha subunit